MAADGTRVHSHVIFVLAWTLFVALAYFVSQQDTGHKAAWDPFEIRGVPEVRARARPLRRCVPRLPDTP